MHEYRISKYDPSKRDPGGAYRGDDWTSVSDIGRRFDDGSLTANRYLAVERSYIGAIVEALRQARPTNLRVVEIEIHDDTHVPLALRAASRRLLESIPHRSGGVSVPDALRFAKATLRELAWGKVESSDGFYVHFGYDYYMYIGDRRERLPNFRARDLFAEVFRSPYQSGGG